MKYIVIFSFLLIGGCAVSTQTSFIPTIERIKLSIVPIVCAEIKPGGTTAEVKSIEGSGFIIADDGTFLTADHVLSQMENAKRTTPCPLAALYLPQGGWRLDAPRFQIDFFLFAPKDCTRSKEIDLAACKSPRQFKSGTLMPVVFDSSIQPDGTPIAFTGFPLNYTVPLSSIGTVSGYMTVIDERGPREIIMDKAAWPGASGSPIYLQDGKVVGILVLRGIGDGSGRAIGRPSRFIQEFLTSAKEKKNPSEK